MSLTAAPQFVQIHQSNDAALRAELAAGLLAKPPRKTFLLGHAHAFQVIPRLPDEPHDIKVKAVATPQGVIRCRVR